MPVQIRAVRLVLASLMSAAACCLSAPASAQPPLLGPTTSQAMPASTTWPAAPPARIYVLPFRMDPALQQQLAQQAAPVIPQGPVRSLFASRPRVVDAVTGYDRSEPPGVAVARLVAEEMASAGWPAVFWSEATQPPADGWRLYGEVVNLDEGSAMARNMIGFGAGNATLGIDIALADPATAGGRPFFVLDSSDRGRRAPGTLAIGAVAGFNPAVVAGKIVASNSGLADVTQQRRMADEIANAVADAVNARAAQPAR
ncbi:MAG: DUF4410 domain-containing protein [Planctomycetota bacterium]